MTTMSHAVMEMRQVVARAEARLKTRKEVCAEDHRTETVGDLMEALDRVDPGLGQRLLVAMYPRASVPDAEAAR